MRKMWKRPQLQILVRGGKEERVLATCKGHPYSGQDDQDWKCAIITEPSCQHDGCLAIWNT